MTDKPEDPALSQTRARARSRERRKRTSQREHAESGEQRTGAGDEQSENAEERFRRPRPVESDEAAPGDRGAKQELEHDPALAARAELGKPRGAGHRQRSSLRLNPPALWRPGSATPSAAARPLLDSQASTGLGVGARRPITPQELLA